jgi:hypothetical protein
MVAYIAQQLGINPTMFALYSRRYQTRFDHGRRVARYLGVRTATREDRRAALLAAINAAAATDDGLPIAIAVVNEFRRRNALMLPDGALEKIGLAGRAIARKRAEAALLDGLSVTNWKALMLFSPLIRTFSRPVSRGCDQHRMPLAPIIWLVSWIA